MLPPRPLALTVPQCAAVLHNTRRATIDQNRPTRAIQTPALVYHDGVGHRIYIDIVTADACINSFQLNAALIGADRATVIDHGISICRCGEKKQESNHIAAQIQCHGIAC